MDCKWSVEVRFVKTYPSNPTTIKALSNKIGVGNPTTKLKNGLQIECSSHGCNECIFKLTIRKVFTKKIDVANPKTRLTYGLQMDSCSNGG